MQDQTVGSPMNVRGQRKQKIRERSNKVLKWPTAICCTCPSRSCQFITSYEAGVTTGTPNGPSAPATAIDWVEPDSATRAAMGGGRH
ncbi:hypothetical protein SRHO_G00077850 [Serrasalmus rhombeus]